MKLEFSSQIFKKHKSIKFNENPSIGSRFVPCGQKDRQTDTTKLTVVFPNFANAPKIALWFAVYKAYFYLTSPVGRNNCEKHSFFTVCKYHTFSKYSTMRYNWRNISDNCEILNSVSDISERGLFSEFSTYVSTHLPISNLKLWKCAPPFPRCGTEFFSSCSPPLSAIVINHTTLGVTESSLWVTPLQECIVPPCSDGQRPVISTLALYAAYIHSTLMADGRQIIPVLADQFSEHIVTNQGYHTPSFPRRAIFNF